MTVNLAGFCFTSSKAFLKSVPTAYSCRNHQTFAGVNNVVHRKQLCMHEDPACSIISQNSVRFTANHHHHLGENGDHTNGRRHWPHHFRQSRQYQCHCLLLFKFVLSAVFSTNPLHIVWWTTTLFHCDVLRYLFNTSGYQKGNY